MLVSPGHIHVGDAQHTTARESSEFIRAYTHSSKKYRQSRAIDLRCELQFTIPRCGSLSILGVASCLLASLHLTSLRGRQCQLRDDAPTVARTTTRPSMTRQSFSRRVRRYPVSFGRRTLHRSAHPPRAPTTYPDNTKGSRTIYWSSPREPP